MYFLVYEVSPKPAHRCYGEVDGAFVSLFVNEHIKEPAVAAAEDFVASDGWDIVAFTEAYAVSLEDYPPGHESRDRYLQAEQDGVVATFHTWPIGAPDE